MRLITLAIHTFPHAEALKQALEREGISVTLQNVNLEHPEVTPGVRVRIPEESLALALRIVENPEVFGPAAAKREGSARPVVLLPVDFAPYSERAAAIAFAEAARLKGRVVVLHAYASAALAAPSTLTRALDFDTAEMTVEADAEVTADVQRLLEALATRLRDAIRGGRLAAAPFDTVAREGLPEEVVNEVARELKPKVIVMGTRGADHRRRDVVGSVTAEVMDTCRFPVYALPVEAEPTLPAGRRPKVLFFALPDQQDILAVDALHSLLPDGPAADVTLACLPARRRPFSAKALDNLVDYCRSHYPNSTFTPHMLDAASAAMRLMRLERMNTFDLLAIPNRHRNVLARFFNPGLAHRVLFHSHRPMLVIPV